MNFSVSIPYKWRTVSVVVGGFLMHMVFGTAYTFGNFDPYITSYMRNKGSSLSLTYIECSWIFVTDVSCQAASMPFVGMVEKKLGMRWTCLLGSLTISLGVVLSYFSVQQSFGALVFTHGVMFGVGCGVSYMLPMTCAMKWMPNNPGLASGIVNGGVGIGAMVFNSVETYFINPDNKRVEKEVNGETYFDQEDVLERVPNVFLLLGGVYAAMQLVGCLLLSDPPSSQTIESPCTTDDNSSELEDDVTIPLLDNRKKADNVTISLLNDGQKVDEKRETNGDVATTQMEEGEDSDLTPLQALKTLDFYLFFFIFFFNALGVVFLNSLYKAYGLSFINDDVFLSLVGTASSVFNVGGRVFWGFLADKISFKLTTILMSSVFICLMLTLQATPLTTRYLFMLYICLLIGTGVGTFTMIPAAAAKRFGKKHVTTIYGLIFISQIFTGPLTVAIAQSLQLVIGWNGLFFVIAGLSSIGLMLSFVFNAKDKNGRVV